MLTNYTELGYAVVRGLFKAGEVQAVRDAITRIVNSSDEHSQQMVQMEPAVESGSAEPSSRELGVRKLFRMAVHDPFFRDLARHDGMSALARQVLGADINLMQSMLLMKPPGISGEKVWHQDNAYFRLEPARVIGFWVACDDTDVANGCMHLVPRSHLRGVLPHTGEGDLYGLTSPPDFSDPNVLPIPLEAGDALLFHGEICHGTPANTTNTRRRALQYHYSSATSTGAERVAELGLSGASPKPRQADRDAITAAQPARSPRYTAAPGQSARPGDATPPWKAG